MERFTNSSEYDRQQAQQHARVVAFGIALAAFAIAGIIIIARNEIYTWLAFWQSALVGMVAWGLTYAIVYVIALPTEPGDWSDTLEREIPELPTPPTGETKHQFTAVFGGRLRVGNRLEQIPADVGEDNLIHIAVMRQRGALDTISLRALDSIGISRNAKHSPNAQTVLAFLSRVGAVDNNGNWTSAGRRDFPSPTDDNLSVDATGVTLQSSHAATATATTGQRHPSIGSGQAYSGGAS